MWLSNSSVGRKVVMSVTGIALILFLTFHCAMNVVALISPSGYNWICEMLGANWYAVAATMVLACLFVIHLVYAFWLTWQNRKARGNERYAVTDKPKTVEWASQNMLVLGIIVVLGLCLHLFNFWAKMMLPELNGTTDLQVLSNATNGIYHIKQTFSNVIPKYVLAEVEKAYGTGDYESGYVKEGLKKLGLENFAIQIQVQDLGGNYYRLYHNIYTW